MRRGLADPTQHRILPERISKEPLGPVVREGDDEWFNIVKWTLFALINAEELGVTQLNLKSMESVRTPAIRRLIGLDGDYGAGLRLARDWMAKAISAAGNYGEMYDRNFGPPTGAALLRGPNALWTKGGLLYAPPIR
jgi:general L-amino acid transport system substrate-binding protein